ncbi:MAG: type II toxin-antitoxin system VapC family toxin [Gammaproteobacteria bacterium]|nr:type II toxin-antitoxin system VapC family toxin [Gammaproteobacteria bacterium]MCW8840292.1 type II toxin-antitoxin system VapC family toxin [Gammaproteobacteria bacterium]MCW8928393.1 type II toxin-antitoxin system VapC family toxin [Gammaproteobacteria bacterium]MCW8957917.1 type II toxin-antitoxin system VapC family toxin [Gammaproteobacteria bacterium]MCW8972314.1 type II toxin-antitoxin system VapC family toxin [Gammaproteobacteria bacterium]
MSTVVDASALLAFLHKEPGAEKVEAALDGARVSAVNWAEVVQKALRQSVDTVGMQAAFIEVGVQFEAFTPTQAETAARLWEPGKALGLSLADRACIALASELSLPILTGDRAWTRLDIDVEIVLFR